jgi:thiol-disulfide isomerase/thioredoxin
MELVFIRTKVCKYSDAAEPFVAEFAKANNLKVTKYSSVDNNVPKQFDKKEYPILYFVENNEILGYVKGFGLPENQLNNYESELKLIKNPELRNIETINSNEEEPKA